MALMPSSDEFVVPRRIDLTLLKLLGLIMRRLRSAAFETVEFKLLIEVDFGSEFKLVFEGE